MTSRRLFRFNQKIGIPTVYVWYILKQLFTSVSVKAVDIQQLFTEVEVASGGYLPSREAAR